MATTNALFTFDADLESWTLTTGQNVTGTRLTGDGYPNTTACVRWLLATKNNNRASDMRRDLTWEQLGVPSGDNVTHVEIDYYWRCATYTSGGTSNQTGPCTLRNPSNNNVVATLTAAIGFTGTSAWANAPSSPQEIPAAFQASNSLVRLSVENTLNTANVTGATIDLRQDYVAVVITHEAPVVAVDLEPDAITNTQTVAVVDLTPTYELIASDTAHTQALASVALDVVVSLSPASVAHIQSLDPSAISIALPLEPDGLSHAQSAQSSAVGLAYALTAESALHAQSLEPGALDVAAGLTPDSISHIQTLPSAAVDTVSLLSVDSLLSTQIQQPSAITQDHSVTVESAIHAQALAPSEVSAASDDLLVDNISHTQAVAGVELGDVLKPFSEVSNDGWEQYGVADSMIAALRQRSMDAGIRTIQPRAALLVELLSPDGQTVLATWTHNSISSEATQYDRDVSSTALSGTHRMRFTAVSTS
jgi:hypothetical protein